MDGRSATNGAASTSSSRSTASSLVTGWAQLHGHPIGILANAQGVLFCQEAQKAAQFIQLANQTDTPLLFLHNTTGYMVGSEYEQGGIIKHGAQMINAVSNSKVPHLTVIIGASYGAGNYGMSGRAYDPRFLFTWPNAKSAVMGPAQLAGVLSIVARQAAEAKGQPFDEEGVAAIKAMVEEQIEEQALPYFLSGMALRRRRHRPARHPHHPGHLPVASSATCPIEGADRLRRLPDVTERAVIQPRKCWSPTGARSPAGSSGPAAGSASGPSRSTPTPTPARRSCAEADVPSGCPATPRPRPTCAATWSSRRRRQGRRRRDPPRLRIPVRERRLRPRRRRRRPDLDRPDPDDDRRDGLEDRRPRS